MMTPEETKVYRLGREIIRMIGDVRASVTNAKTTAYGIREFTYPGGSAHVIVVHDKALADLFEFAAKNAMDVKSTTPKSLIV